MPGDEIEVPKELREFMLEGAEETSLGRLPMRPALTANISDRSIFKMITAWLICLRGCPGMSSKSWKKSGFQGSSLKYPVTPPKGEQKNRQLRADQKAVGLERKKDRIGLKNRHERRSGWEISDLRLSEPSAGRDQSGPNW